jgi:hypothetical protein
VEDNGNESIVPSPFTVCQMCSTPWANGPVVGVRFNVFKAEAEGRHGNLHFGFGEVTGQATAGAGLGGEVNALHISTSIVPTLYLDDGTPVIGAGGGGDIKILGAEANAGIVDYSLKLGAEVYAAKGERQTTVRIWHVQITYATESCFECVGASGSFGKEISGFLAWEVGEGFKLKFDYVPSAK